MNNPRRCSDLIKELAEDFKTQAKERNFALFGPMHDESQKVLIQHFLERLAEELEELSEAALQGSTEVAAIRRQVDAIAAKARNEAGTAQ